VRGRLASMTDPLAGEADMATRVLREISTGIALRRGQSDPGT
jgi:hypothetical protein